MYIHKEAKATLTLGAIVLLGLSIVSHLYGPAWLAVIVTALALGLYVFLISFFRNPKRPIPQISDDILYAPADGKVVVIEKVHEPEVIKGDAMQVSIFMSPLNVHVNRAPLTGTIAYYKYHAGKYLAAWNPKSSTENERTTIGLQTKHGVIVMRQIAGALARRIVCYASEGETYHQGNDIGFIKLGSRVDIFLPLDATITVKMDEVVKGNLTKIATWN